MRKFKIIDEENNIEGEIEFDEVKEFLEIWGLEDSNGKQIYHVDIKRNPFKKQPFAVLNKKLIN